ncbi:glycosyltransferase family 4 protein [Sphingomonas asaccharolytica]|uniref:glycosyltransferase family 4 protein n=1 Tax=Sphingomonas asaccharolytica TaxID=40681 RepID=UPI000AC98E48|nr:glycosyltransferase family 4 protein [Sphingomonas asaccharolytica]
MARDNTARTRLVVAVSHPIQHFVSFYRALAADASIDLHVIFSAPIGVTPYYDEEMRSEIAWNMDMLAGYSHEFLDSREGRQVSFWSMNSPRVAERLAAARPDAIIIYGYAQMNPLRALFWARRHRVPVMMISDSEQLQHRAWWKRVAKSVLVRRVYGACTAFLSVGDRNEDHYRDYGARDEAIFRSPFTIDEASFRAAAHDRARHRAAVRAELGIPDDCKVLLFVGKLSARKRPDDLIAALKVLQDRNRTGYRALFLGNGELTNTLSATAKAESLPAIFAGFVNVDRLPPLYAASDILVHPSQHDPHPLICSEAACVGLPMILSDRVGAMGATDVARPGENALSFPCGNIERLVDIVLEIGEDPARLAAMGVRSRRIFDELSIARSVAGVKEALRYAGA